MSRHGALAEEIIDELSAYMASRNATYGNHEAVVDLWIARRREKNQRGKPFAKEQTEERVRYGNFDPMEAWQHALERSVESANAILSS